tara:strand:- start:6534 stop:7118 length:585 start_codon:yes stop_codon:yes gene_type:complete
MPFLSEKGASASSAGSGGGYLNPSKIQSGTSVRFALLDDNPLEFFEVWGETSEGSVKPFRFRNEPTPDDVNAEFGSDYSRRLNRDGSAPEPAKFAIAVPVFNHDAGSVQVLQVSQKSINREFDSISQMEDYSNLLEWDFVLGKEGNGLNTEYSLRAVPRKKGTQDAITAAWEEAKSNGFDISRLLSGGNPFKEG